MTRTDNNVLLPLALPTQSSLRGAVAKIIAAVQRDHELTDEELADELLDMLPDLQAAVAALNALIVRAERIAA